MERLIGTWKLHASDNPKLLEMLVLFCVLTFPCFFGIPLCVFFASKREFTIEKSGNIWTMSGIEVLAFELDKPFIKTEYDNDGCTYDILTTISWANNELIRVGKIAGGRETRIIYRINENDQLEVRTENLSSCDNTCVYRRTENAF